MRTVLRTFVLSFFAAQIAGKSTNSVYVLRLSNGSTSWLVLLRRYRRFLGYKLYPYCRVVQGTCLSIAKHGQQRVMSSDFVSLYVKPWCYVEYCSLNSSCHDSIVGVAKLRDTPTVGAQSQ